MAGVAFAASKRRSLADPQVDEGLQVHITCEHISSSI